LLTPAGQPLLFFAHKQDRTHFFHTPPTHTNPLGKGKKGFSPLSWSLRDNAITGQPITQPIERYAKSTRSFALPNVLIILFLYLCSMASCLWLLIEALTVN